MNSPSLVVGDAAFAQTPQLTKPFPERGLDDIYIIYIYINLAARQITSLCSIIDAFLHNFVDTLRKIIVIGLYNLNLCQHFVVHCLVCIVTQFLEISKSL